MARQRKRTKHIHKSKIACHKEKTKIGKEGNEGRKGNSCRNGNMPFSIVKCEIGVYSIITQCFGIAISCNVPNYGNPILISKILLLF